MKKYRKFIDYLILKPIWLLTIIVGLIDLFNKKWLEAIAALIVMFVIGLVGQALYPEKTASQLSRGNLK